ncbi:MAG: thymidylate synthase, partial [Deltaproteobacteria bacterium]|nr:thymidylate synthase [Deltaproteobacteria bacterium]
MLEPIVISGTNLPDVWHQTLYKAIEVGRDFTIDRGSNEGQKRKEFDFITIHASCPGSGELLPKLNPALNLDDPCAQDFLDDYLPYLMTGEEKENEAYTYG